VCVYFFGVDSSIGSSQRQEDCDVCGDRHGQMSRWTRTYSLTHAPTPSPSPPYSLSNSLTFTQNTPSFPHTCARARVISLSHTPMYTCAYSPLYLSLTYSHPRGKSEAVSTTTETQKHYTNTHPSPAVHLYEHISLRRGVITYMTYMTYTTTHSSRLYITVVFQMYFV